MTKSSSRSSRRQEKREKEKRDRQAAEILQRSLGETAEAAAKPVELKPYQFRYENGGIPEDAITARLNFWYEQLADCEAAIIYRKSQIKDDMSDIERNALHDTINSDIYKASQIYEIIIGLKAMRELSNAQ